MRIGGQIVNTLATTTSHARYLTRRSRLTTAIAVAMDESHYVRAGDEAHCNEHSRWNVAISPQVSIRGPSRQARDELRILHRGRIEMSRLDCRYAIRRPVEAKYAHLMIQMRRQQRLVGAERHRIVVAEHGIDV